MGRGDWRMAKVRVRVQTMSTIIEYRAHELKSTTPSGGVDKIHSHYVQVTLCPPAWVAKWIVRCSSQAMSSLPSAK